jgi:hypothetical protein
MTITALPTPPARSDTPAVFVAAADAFVAALPVFVTEVNETAAAMNLNATSDTSASSVAIGTGAKTFTVTAGKSFLGGMFLVIADTAAPSTNFMFGQVTSYSGTSLVMNITATGGSGTKTAWTISQSAAGLAGVGLQKFAAGTAIASASTVDLSTATGNLVHITGTTQINTVTMSSGLFMGVVFDGALTLAHNSTSNSLPGGVNISTAAGDRALYWSDGTTSYCLNYERAGGNLVNNYLTGLTLSTAGSSATMTTAAGQAANSTNKSLMTLGASIAKTTSAWAVGTATGGLDTGAIANSTWYHFYLIRRPDTGVVDVVFSTNASAPTLPANYTEYRRIGSGLTNGSAQWVKFSQRGDEFLWDAAVVDIDAVNPGTAAVSRTLSTPLGVQVVALISGGAYSGTNLVGVVLSALDVSDQQAQAPATGALTGFSTGGTGSGAAHWMISSHQVRTNTSSQIRSRINVSGAADRVGIITRGWLDSRGRDL